MIKSYEEMRKIDVEKFCETRKAKDDNNKEIEVPYLNWAKCIDILHDNGAKNVYFTPLKNENGSSLFMTDKVFTDSKGNTNQCYEVGVHIVIDDLEFDFTGPLMNGSNPVKDNSMSQQRVWNCQTRLFVKGVAIRTGLGFDLWLKEEVEVLKADKDEDLAKHNILAVRERLQQLITLKLQGGLTKVEICEALNIDEETMSAYLSYFALLDRLEKAIAKL